MDKSEFMEGVHLLQNAYGRKLTAEQLKLYYDNLKDLDKNVFIKNIKEQIKINPFMPTVANLISNHTNFEERKYTEEFLNQFYANKGG